MSELDFHEVLRMFDIFLAILENPTLSEDTNTDNVVKAFRCAHFIEAAIVKACDIGKENVLENHLHNHWLEESRSNLYKCSELRNACDRLLELYLKDTAISTDIVDEFIKLYTQHCGSDRLNDFFRHAVINGVCANIVIESLEKLGISACNMQDEALIMTWESLVSNGDQYEVSNCIAKMFDDGFHSKIVQFAVHLNDNHKIKQLILELLSNKLVGNNVNVCLALVNVEKKLLWKLMESNVEFYTNFLDAIFYFARRMKQVENHWISDCELEYEHVLKIVRTLLNGPRRISEIMHNRLQLVVTHHNDTVWHKIEKDIGW